MNASFICSIIILNVSCQVLHNFWSKQRLKTHIWCVNVQVYTLELKPPKGALIYRGILWGCDTSINNLVTAFFPLLKLM